MMKYFDFLATDLKQRSRANKAIGKAFRFQRQTFCYDLTSDQLVTAEEDMLGKTNLKNVVGTIVVSHHQLVRAGFVFLFCFIV